MSYLDTSSAGRTFPTPSPLPAWHFAFNEGRCLLAIATLNGSRATAIETMKALKAGLVFVVVGPPLAGFMAIAAIQLINFSDTSFGQAIASSAILVIAGFWMVYLFGGLPALITGLTVAWLHGRLMYPAKAVAGLTGMVVGLLWGFLLSARYPDLKGVPPVLAIASAIASFVCSTLAFPAQRATSKDARLPR